MSPLNLADLSVALREQGLGQPRFLVDQAALQANIDCMRRIAQGERLRLVLKSLPCPRLIDHLMQAGQTRKLMVFHLPFLLQAVRCWPQADILMGKPLPEAAIRSFYQQFDGTDGFVPGKQLHWLVDTPDRVGQLANLAREIGQSLSVAVELDVGMHRGGATLPDEVEAILARISQSRGGLTLSGFMGYDAHIGKSPPWVNRSRALARANSRFRALIDATRETAPALMPKKPIINGSGSPTCVYHDESSPVNELAVGSAFLKPAEFDLPQLDEFQPACWIAAPVIKRQRGVQLPFIESLSRWSRRDMLFVYGGRWHARPAWPAGMRESRLYGSSFNQQLFTIPRSVMPGPDDFVFFRPLQSEQVMLQLGDVLLIDDQRIAAHWPVLQQSI